MKRNKDYYDEERKEKFLIDTLVEKDENGNPRMNSVGEYIPLYKRKYGIARNTFSRLANFEREFGKDFCELKRVEDDDFVSEIYNKWLSNISDNYSVSIHNVLRDYILWCCNNNIISHNQYFMHPFYEKTTTPWSYEGGQRESRSTRIKNQLDYISNGEIDKSNYIFPSENDLFDYIKTIFSDSKNTMYAAVLCLLYYGFSSEEIPYIRRDDVDEKNTLVRNTVITNNIAWKLICRAKYAVDYISGIGSHLFYAETPYLIRSFRNTEVGAVSINFVKRIYLKEKEAVDELPAGSKYKGILVKVPLLKTLRIFYQIVQEEQIYDTHYVAEKFRNGEYDTTMQYRQYKTMCAKIKK